MRMKILIVLFLLLSADLAGANTRSICGNVKITVIPDKISIYIFKDGKLFGPSKELKSGDSFCYGGLGEGKYILWVHHGADKNSYVFNPILSTSSKKARIINIQVFLKNNKPTISFSSDQSRSPGNSNIP